MRSLASLLVCLLLATALHAAPPQEAVVSKSRVPQPSPPSSKEPKPAATASSKDQPGVQITGSISSQVIETGGMLSGSITIANRSASEISAVKVVARTPLGFHYSGGRLDSDAAESNSCPAPSSFQQSPPKIICEIPGNVPIGAERALSIQWQADSAQADQSVDVTIEWTVPATAPAAPPAQSSYRDISIGQVSSRNGWEFLFAKYPAFLPLLSGLVGGLIVAGIQTGLSFLAKKAEDKRANDEKVKEEGRAAAQKLEEDSRAAETRQREADRAHLNTTWDLMLPKSHEIATRHYVFIYSYLNYAIAQIESHNAQVTEAKSETDKSRDAGERGFLSLVLFNRQVQALYDAIGAMYLKNRIGEEIVSWCLYRFGLLYTDVDFKTRAKYGKLLRAVSPTAHMMDVGDLLHGQFPAPPHGPAIPSNPAAERAPAAHPHLSGVATNAASEDRATIQDTGDSTGPLVVINEESHKLCVDFKDHFDKWAGGADCTKALLILKGLRDVLIFEMNRPYRYWYGGDPDMLQVDADARKVLLELAKDVLPKKDADDLHRKIQAYLLEAETKGTTVM